MERWGARRGPCTSGKIPPVALPDPGQRIGRYRIVAELGRGSMARVYRAEDPNLGRQVALKIMAPTAPLDADELETLRRRFLLEAQAAGRLRHPGIVLVLDADTDPASGIFYIAMELVEGRSLEALVRERGRLPVATAVDLALQVAAALGYAHAEGVVHRDVKPANILVSEAGPVKVSDFGVAKLGIESLTLAGQVLGSPFFMAPEQVRGEPVDGRADLFSLGAVLYRCLAGEVPFGGDSIASVTFKVVNVDPRPLRSHAPETPAALEATIERAMAKDPADRFQTARAMADALEASIQPGAAVPAAPVAVSTSAEPAGREKPATGGGVGGDTVVLTASPQPPQAPRSGPSSPTRPQAGGGERRRKGAAGALRKLWARPFLTGLVLAVVVLAAGLLVAAGRGRSAPAAARDVQPPASPLVVPVERGGGTASPPSETTPLALPETAPPPPQPPPPAATLEVTYLNRLRSGWMTLWVDGELLGSWPLEGPGNVFKRAAGRRVSERLEVPAGDHTIEVRIQGGPPHVDARQVIQGKLEARGRRSLRVALNPLTENLRLRWEE